MEDMYELVTAIILFAGLLMPKAVRGRLSPRKIIALFKKFVQIVHPASKKVLSTLKKAQRTKPRATKRVVLELKTSVELQTSTRRSGRSTSNSSLT